MATAISCVSVLFIALFQTCCETSLQMYVSRLQISQPQAVNLHVSRLVHYVET